MTVPIRSITQGFRAARPPRPWWSPTIPSPASLAEVVGLTFLTSIATDAGGNLVLEFLPNIIRKFPIMEKLRLE